MLIENSLNFNIDLNAKNILKQTAFSLVCKLGQMEMAEFLIQKSIYFNIDLNAKDFQGNTAFHLACQYEYDYNPDNYDNPSLLNDETDMAKLLIKNSLDFNINLNATNDL